MEPIPCQSKLSLIIPLEIKNILDYLVQKPLEWTAFAEVEEIKTDDGMYFLVRDLYFPKQENSGSATEIEPKDYAEFGASLAKRKVNTSMVKLWIHSHNSMSAFWSGTDTNQMSDFKSGNYMLSLVVAQSGNWKACFSLFNPLRIDFDMPIIINDNVTDQATLDKYKAELEAVEKKKTYDYKPTKKAWWEEEQDRKDNKNNKKDKVNYATEFTYTKKEMKEAFKSQPMTAYEIEMLEDLIKSGASRKEAFDYVLTEREKYGYPCGYDYMRSDYLD